MATLTPGSVVAVDALTYPGFKVLAHALHLELAPVPVTASGPDLDALEDRCATRPVRAIYTMPTLHNPLGAVMNQPDRARLVGIARRHGQLLIEDASYAYLAEDPPPPLAALAPDITVYVSGLSKSVATGLRVGYLAARAALVPALERAIRATTWNTPALTCRWLNDGTADELEAQKRDDAKIRQAIARDALAGLPQHQPPQLLLHLAPPARRRPRRPHRRHPYPQPHLRLNRRTIHHDHPHSAGHPARTRLSRPRHPASDLAHSR